MCELFAQIEKHQYLGEIGMSSDQPSLLIAPETVTRELERAHRTGTAFVLAFIDGDGPLTAVDAEHSVTFGVVEAEPADSLQDLIARADADLLQARRT